jgi:hypothetical protein
MKLLLEWVDYVDVITMRTTPLPSLVPGILSSKRNITLNWIEASCYTTDSIALKSLSHFTLLLYIRKIENGPRCEAIKSRNSAATLQTVCFCTCFDYKHSAKF